MLEEKNPRSLAQQVVVKATPNEIEGEPLAALTWSVFPHPRLMHTVCVHMVLGSYQVAKKTESAISTLSIKKLYQH